MTLPTPDAQPPRFLSQYPHPPHSPSHAHSQMPETPPPPRASFPMTPPPEPFFPEMVSSPAAQKLAADSTDYSWDLATGGLKTLTAKRELPPRSGQRTTNPPPDVAAPRSYMFFLVILVCVITMLISGGVVLFMMLQP